METKLNIRLQLDIMFTCICVILHLTLMYDNSFSSNYLSGQFYGPSQGCIWASSNH